VAAAVFVARSFRTGEEWRCWSSLEFRARAIRDGKAQLENVLYHRRAIVVGEAGSGKSLVARKAIELGANRDSFRCSYRSRSIPVTSRR